jgi:two-component system response regulator AlgR
MTAAKFTAVIIDDEPLAVEGVQRLCAASAVAEVIGTASDGAAGLELIAASRPQAVFLDIAMPGRSGLEIAETLRSRPSSPLVVLVTANHHFATEAFDLNVVDYVLKPLVSDRFARAVERVAVALHVKGGPAAADAFWLPHRGSVVRVSASEIHRIEAERDYVRFIAADRSFLLRATLTDVLARLDPARFVRIHRSTVLAVDRIAGLRHAGAGAWVALDLDGGASSIGRSYLDTLRGRLGVAEAASD